MEVGVHTGAQGQQSQGQSLMWIKGGWVWIYGNSFQDLLNESGILLGVEQTPDSGSEQFHTRLKHGTQIKFVGRGSVRPGPVG